MATFIVDPHTSTLHNVAQIARIETLLNPLESAVEESTWNATITFVTGEQLVAHSSSDAEEISYLCRRIAAACSGEGVVDLGRTVSSVLSLRAERAARDAEAEAASDETWRWLDRNLLPKHLREKLGRSTLSDRR